MSITHARFSDRAAYASLVLRGAPAPHTAPLPFALEPASLESVLYGIGAVLLAAALAAFGLRRPQLGGIPLLVAPARAVKAVHSGVVGDYVAWLVFGFALLGGLFAFLLR